MKTPNKFIKWLKVSILLLSVILILIGFAFGYIYNNYKSGACTERPLSYGVEKLNELNNDNFMCSCSSLSGKLEPFSFNEEGIVEDNLFPLSP